MKAESIFLQSFGGTPINRVLDFLVVYEDFDYPIIEIAHKAGVGYAKVNYPNAMTLATADENSRPSTRIVILRYSDERGFVFFTNYESRKGRELANNPAAALLFFWPELQRQVRIEGNAWKIPEKESDEYFDSKPLDTIIPELASRQSEIIADIDEVEKEYHRLTKKYSEEKSPRPAHWGGYRVVPNQVEFWQGKESRLHDRIRYRRENEENWTIERLAP